MIKTLKLHGCDVADFDFSRLTQLEKIYLWDAENFSDEQRAQLPTTCKIFR